MNIFIYVYICLVIIAQCREMIFVTQIILSNEQNYGNILWIYDI